MITNDSHVNSWTVVWWPAVANELPIAVHCTQPYDAHTNKTKRKKSNRKHSTACALLRTLLHEKKKKKSRFAWCTIATRYKMIPPVASCVLRPNSIRLWRALKYNNIIAYNFCSYVAFYVYAVRCICILCFIFAGLMLVVVVVVVHIYGTIHGYDTREYICK